MIPFVLAAALLAAPVGASDVKPIALDEAYAAARAVNSLPPEAHHRHRVDHSLMRTQDGRWTYRYDRALRSPSALRLRDREAAWRSCADIAVPTQIIRGSLRDILSPEVAARMMQTIPNAVFAVIEGSGHAVPLDAPDGFLAAAREFLKG